uniref:Uncharacterized protein n=1 Tax=Arundo donax TaxID=35708 RepID=A0A0A8XU93_ARUDO
MFTLIIRRICGRLGFGNKELVLVVRQHFLIAQSDFRADRGQPTTCALMMPTAQHSQLSKC